MNLQKIALILATALPSLIGCMEYVPPCEGDNYCNVVADATGYEVTPTTKTPKGISVDASGQSIDLKDLDRKTDELETCSGISIRRNGFVVKIPDDWFSDPDCRGGTPMFPCHRPDMAAFVRDFGNDVPEKCIQICAGAVQPPDFTIEHQVPNSIVVPPGFAAYKHELLHIVTGISDHADATFAELAARCDK